jgi:hypothetical protein
MNRGRAFHGFGPYLDNHPLQKVCLFPLPFNMHQEPGESTSTLHHRTGEIEEDGKTNKTTRNAKMLQAGGGKPLGPD